MLTSQMPNKNLPNPVCGFLSLAPKVQPVFTFSTKEDATAFAAATYKAHHSNAYDTWVYLPPATGLTGANFSVHSSETTFSFDTQEHAENWYTSIHEKGNRDFEVKDKSQHFRIHIKRHH